MRLVYLGRLVKDYGNDESVNPRIWNLVKPGHPSDGSSLSVNGLRLAGILDNGGKL